MSETIEIRYMLIYIRKLLMYMRLARAAAFEAIGPNSRQIVLLLAVERARAGGAPTRAAVPAQPRPALALDREVAPATAALARLGRELRAGLACARRPPLRATGGVEGRGAVVLLGCPRRHALCGALRLPPGVRAVDLRIKNKRVKTPCPAPPPTPKIGGNIFQVPR
jgi:hypothetical protein